MARQPSSILTPADKKTQVKNLKGEIAIFEKKHKALEKELEATAKEIEDMRARLAVLAPPKTKEPE